MPIGTGEKHNIFENIIRPAVEEFKFQGNLIYKCDRSDLISQSGSITHTILNNIYKSDVVIADLSGLNPNVLYELGIRHALRNKTILIASKQTTIPFDIGDVKIIFYEDRIGGEKSVIPQIQSLLQMFSENEENVIDSPVIRAISDLPASRDNRSILESEYWLGQIYWLEQQNKELQAKLTFEEQTKISDCFLNQDIKDTISTLFKNRDIAVTEKNRENFLKTQMEDKEIDGGSSEGYLMCSRMKTTILKSVRIKTNLHDKMAEKFSVLVREDFERNNQYTHFGYIIYFITRTDEGLKILNSNNVGRIRTH